MTRRFWHNRLAGGLLLALLLAGLVACAPAGPPLPPPPVHLLAPTATPLPTSTQTPLPTPTQTPPPPAGADSAARLAANQYPLRDDLALARAFRGQTPAATPAGPGQPPAIGTRQSFNILSYTSNEVSVITAELLAVSDHAYFWFDVALTPPVGDALAAAAGGFDAIYGQVTATFGQEASPGIDGDPRIHIVHAAPDTLCGSPAGCSLAGYFSAADGFPLAAQPNSNQREMFVMNAQQFATGSYLGVLAHEFRHMVEFNYDRGEADWAAEGSAVLAEELAGFPAGPTASGNAFLADPDLQLNSWSDSDKYRHYGQGYVLSRYLYQQLGPALYTTLATHPAAGLAALDDLAAAGLLPRDGQAMWLDWLAALAIHDRPGVPARYELGREELNTAASAPLASLPGQVTTTVSQFGADYYDLTGVSGTLRFRGAAAVPLLATAPAGDGPVWYSGRANFREMRLTRPVDLRGVTAATLTYDVYYDLEYGYDYAYVAVSADGGVTWQGLAAAGMQGLAAADNPAGEALTPRFYTGRSAGWQTEHIDLTPYAGQQLLLRFMVLTDPILTWEGVALANVAIPELGFVDVAGANPAGGWQAEGFVPVTPTLPQSWYLQLITFPGGVPTVTLLSLDEINALQLPLTGEEAILVVAAAAPATLHPAGYTLSWSPPVP